MTDSELLELAAKAAGYKVRLVLVNGDLDIGADRERWNPLTDDGDALRLAVKLDMDVDINRFCEVAWVNMDTSETFSHIEDWGAGDVALKERMHYVRRAIVRAAAAMAPKETA